MASNEPQASGSGESKFGGGSEPVKQEAAQKSVQEQDTGKRADVKVHPSAVVETTTTTTKTMDVDGKPTQVQETVKTRPQNEKPETKKPAEDKPENEDPQQQQKKDKAKPKDEDTLQSKGQDDGKKKKRHWLLENLDEKLASFKDKGKPQDWMTGYKFGYETVAGIFIIAEKLLGIFGPKPAEAGVTPKQGTVAGLHGKEGGTFKMLENAGVSGAKPAPGQKPSVGTQVKQRVEGMKQGAQAARKSAAPGRKR